MLLGVQNRENSSAPLTYLNISKGVGLESPNVRLHAECEAEVQM